MSTTSPILVTGAAGRIGGVGGAVVEALRKRGLPVRALVRREDERAAALRATGAEVAAAFEARLGKFDEAVSEQFRNGDAPEAIRARIEEMAGASGFMLFRTSDHGALLRLAGQTKKAVQYLLGNPLFAVRMTQHDIRAGLYAPLRVLVYEDEGGKTRVEYDRPSSLFGQFGHASVTEVATMLDRKLEQPVAEAIR